MQITCLVKRWEHHTTSGGYDQLANAVGAKIVKRQPIDNLPAKVARKAWRWLTPTSEYLLDYQFGDWLAEFRVLASSPLSPPDVFHVLYGDEQLDLLLRLRRFLPFPLVASFHLPPDHSSVSRRFESCQTYAAERIDAAIVVATSQIQQFASWFGRSKVVYVPHGIDTVRFSPGERYSDGSPIRLLVVGTHMRDWHVIHTVIDSINNLRLPVSFDVVAGEIFFPYFTGCRNTSLHSDISEESLIKFYRNADAALIPVTNATANNSVLEALACGTPVISTAIGGITDYVNDKCGWLFAKGNASSIVDLVQAMCGSREIAESRRDDARNQALMFSWPQIAERMLAVYAAVARGRPPAEATMWRDTCERSSSSVASGAIDNRSAAWRARFLATRQ
jgi:glycosyltransferase involved in cell wall biosynthesis